MELAVNVVLHQRQSLLGHFLAVAVDQLDAVVVVGVVAGRDHDSAVEIIHASNISHRRGGRDMEQVSVCAGSRQTSHQAVLKHVRAATSVLADDDTGGLVVAAVTLTQSVVIPA